MEQIQETNDVDTSRQPFTYNFCLVKREGKWRLAHLFYLLKDFETEEAALAYINEFQPNHISIPGQRD